MINRLEWVAQAEQKLQYEMCVQTPLLRLNTTRSNGLMLFLKEESINPVGSWRQRVARVLFLQALRQRKLEEDKPVVSNSPPSMAMAEAWYAQLLGLPYIAIIPEDCPVKFSMQIEFCSGICHRISCGRLQEVARDVTEELTGVLFDRLTLDHFLLRAAAELLVRETEKQLAQYDQNHSKITFLMGASEYGLNRALKMLCKELRGNSSIRVGVGGMNYGKCIMDLDSQAKVMTEVSPAASLAGVEWLSDLTGRRFSLETGAAYVTVAKRDGKGGGEGECAIIIAESVGCYESGQFLSKIKRAWLNRRESFRS
ncbi:MAG: pyridoxal-phosphate dependent enzyme [Endozoicomonadaceae bacterium]|nr:pyridoxal-phosphate dependent enzyme [Endozoicomonadaceae bacterium]